FLNDANARVPLLNRDNPTHLDPAPLPPQMSDFLKADLTGGTNLQSFETLFQSNLIGPTQSHGAFADNAAFVKFLNDLGYLDPSTSKLFQGLNDVLVKVNSFTSTDNSTAPITLSDTRNANGDGVLTTQVTHSTILDIDLTFKLDQTQVAKLDLGKQ